MNPWLSLLQQHRIIAVIRADNVGTAREMALASAAGGIKLIEIAWNTDRAESLIPKLQQELPDCKIGTGTILDLDMAERAIDCGCSFLFTPHTNPELIAKGVENHIPVIAGALTPTEIVTAWQAGAAAVKVFPIKIAGGVDYLKCLQPVLRDIPLIPTGGITMQNADQYLAAGAIAVGISSHLFTEEVIANDDWTTITLRSQALIQKVQPFQNQ
ncbi:bifunctional 4-hydroxy-2-oxoglutarate aldolase/2-dehydro-3-deoxy-phosphogluconate aldolase [Pseudanabaena mucicola]|uniref:Bifunctional 4-hydroxy-2-oxoglutarate aldolase/2-dehydro-3-deoxy-phosphogluconate aldolase n=1 Tax=Pseudanabaena mucicola FACHB-723 TaxID=2692860 RepID=A0ABR7ZTG9_9CYAN|nr:bifunctional 4-hydroxy-2-oxoglutarate aldolase/2-dehydro-3-deoxy-phosphogluconate aldolase [Pseudanabaena mucicola FACHB-723]